ncbi:hypothetical protein BK127_19990 [Paenibacillus sp. FSL H7-0331]|nr:hypothetical protein BK127_19990 [Paenibacillus sp. FSL H7-0331]
MNNCSQCGNEVLEDSLFCNKCGSRMGTNKEVIVVPKNTKKWYMYAGIGLLVVIIAGTTFILVNNPVSKFKRAVEDNKYIEASIVFNQKIKGNLEDEKKIEGFIKDELNKTTQNFKSNSVDYQKATTSIETIKKLDLLKPEVETTTSIINKLNDSRTSFKKGQEFIGSKNLKEGISEFKKVITDDENYGKAQELISQYTTEYKTVALKDAEQLSSSTNYDKALSVLNDALAILPNDSDISAKKASYGKLNDEKKAIERKKKMEETKASQEVVAEKGSIVVQDSRFKSLYPDMIQIIIRNNTEKTVKNLIVSSLAFDSNGLPIKIKTQFSFSDASFEFVGSAPNVNIIPKATFGEKSGWNLDESHGIKTVLTCVKEVEYYDGSKWTNPYYEYWLAEYKEKPLHD